jgi:L-asparaginase
MRTLALASLTQSTMAPADSRLGGTASLPRVHVMTGPGTLPRNPRNRLEYLRYSRTGEPPLSAAELIERLPELGQFARATAEIGPPPPYEQPDQLVALARTMADRLAEPDIAGLVFTHGTNTIEETAYFLNLTVRREKPIVIVGAQRPFATLSSDGPLNLLNAVRVAAAPASRGKGTLVVVNDTIQAARDVSKTNTYRVETFQSREVGLLGYADPDRIVYYRAPLRRHTTQSEFDLASIGTLPKVPILYAHAGDDGDLVRAAAAAGARGLVIAGTGAGHTNNMRAALAELHATSGIAVVRAARVGAGRVIRDDNWQEPGFVAADNLLPQKARILLQLGLTRTSDPDVLQRMFDEY